MHLGTAQNPETFRAALKASEAEIYASKSKVGLDALEGFAACRVLAFVPEDGFDLLQTMNFGRAKIPVRLCSHIESDSLHIAGLCSVGFGDIFKGCKKAIFLAQFPTFK